MWEMQPVYKENKSHPHTQRDLLLFRAFLVRTCDQTRNNLTSSCVPSGTAGGTAGGVVMGPSALGPRGHF